MTNPVWWLILALMVGGRGSEAAEAAVTANGFQSRARYVDGAGGLVGERYQHEATGLQVVILHIESVPQVFLAFGTPPVSDRGEPHTQEHLLLGRGRRGKTLAVTSEMSLVESTAYTSQTYTAYSFNCAAGSETFHRILGQTLEAMLFPDYTDEEIRREVWHLGVVQDSSTGTLGLEDRGTIFTEMVSAYEKRWIVYRDVGRRLYGDGHPLSYASGGEPDAIRTMTPEHIHEFHRGSYHLSPNLELIVSLPPSIPTSDFLGRLGAMVEELASRPEHQGRPCRQMQLPPPRPSEDRSVLLVPYPNQNEEDTGLAILAWPPRALGSVERHLMRSIFLTALAGGETGHLHRILLDRSTRRLEVPASHMWASLEVTKLTEGATIGFSGYEAGEAPEVRLRDLERVLHEEVSRLAALPPGDETLAAFNRRVETELVNLERQLRQRLSQPPLFGHRRGGGGFWYHHLELVDRLGGEERCLTLEKPLAEVRRQLDGETNPWTEVIEDLGLLDPPIIGLSVPSRAEVERRVQAREARLAEGLSRLQARQGEEDPQVALARLQEDHALAGQVLTTRDAAIHPPPLVEDLPRTLDDDLVWEGTTIAGVPAFRAHFESMPTVEATVCFRVGELLPTELPLLPLVPSLISGVGLRPAEGEPLAYDDLQDLLAREIADLAAWYDLAPDRDRFELVVNAVGTSEEEARRALHWLRRCLCETDLSEENLPRLLDLVQQLSRGSRSRLGGAEEGWVNNPASALRFQRHHLYLSAGSIHTRLHHLFRLRWLLTPPPEGEERDRVETLIATLRQRLVGAGEEPGVVAAGLLELGDADLDPGELGRDLLESLEELVPDLSPASAGRDLGVLLTQLERDLARPPQETLTALRGLLRHLLDRGRARVVLTGRSASLDRLGQELGTVLEALPPPGPDREGQPEVDLTSRAPVILRRLREREGETPAPVHIALVNDTAATGVFVLGCDSAPLTDLGRSTLVGELAGSVFSGAGPHAFFMNTWAAGLAYSNGLRVNPTRERVRYYAERCPDLVQTMRFVTGLANQELGAESRHLAEYAIACLVSQTRASSRFADRGRAQAADLVDGLTPEVIRAHREALLALRDDPELWEDMRAQVVTMTGRVLVGAGARSREQPGGVFLTIAPGRMLDRWEEYVQQVEADYEHVHRIWTSDFWLW